MDFSKAKIYYIRTIMDDRGSYTSTKFVSIQDHSPENFPRERRTTVSFWTMLEIAQWLMLKLVNDR